VCSSDLQDWDFLTTREVRHVGEYLGVDSNTCILVQETYQRRVKMSTEVTCIGCGRKVKLGRYQVQGDYRCAKCRGIEVPKKSKERTYEEKGLHIK
jgi:hypothetical protein